MATGEDSLMTSSDLEEQRKWDEEFRRRSEDLQRMELASRERRQATSAKMSELRQRWEGVERRRQLRSRQGSTVAGPETSTPNPSHNNNNREPPAVLVTGVEAEEDINNNISTVANNNAVSTAETAATS